LRIAVFQRRILGCVDYIMETGEVKAIGAGIWDDLNFISVA
jgi:hypothetical protein